MLENLSLTISIIAIAIALLSIWLSWLVTKVKYYTNYPIITPHFQIQYYFEEKMGNHGLEKNKISINMIALMNDGDMDAKNRLFSVKFFKFNEEKQEWGIYEAKRKCIYSPTIGYRIPARERVGGWSFSMYYRNPEYEFRTKCIWRIEALGLDNKWYCSCWAFKYNIKQEQRKGYTEWLPITLNPRFCKPKILRKNYEKCDNCDYERFGGEYRKKEI